MPRVCIPEYGISTVAVISDEVAETDATTLSGSGVQEVKRSSVIAGTTKSSLRHCSRTAIFGKMCKRFVRINFTVKSISPSAE
jgi:hypothetical protein